MLKDCDTLQIKRKKENSSSIKNEYTQLKVKKEDKTRKSPENSSKLPTKLGLSYSAGINHQLFQRRPK